MKKVLLFCFLIISFILFSYFLKPQKPTATLGSNTFYLEIADSEKARVQGLSNREFLSENSAMLFIFPQKKIQAFWMKNMHFSLDIVWIDKDTIVDFEESAQPEGENPVKRYYSPVPVNKVLELNAGMVKKLKLQKGQKLYFQNLP